MDEKTGEMKMTDTEIAKTLSTLIDEMEKRQASEQSRSRALALTHCETALLWFNKATNGAAYRGG